jgi:hypothetical protein
MTRRGADGNHPAWRGDGEDAASDARMLAASDRLKPEVDSAPAAYEDQRDSDKHAR